MITESNLIDLTREKFKVWETLSIDQLTQIFDENGLLFSSKGKVDTKESLMKKINSERCPPKQFIFQNAVVRVYGTSAVVQGEGAFTFSKSGQTLSTNMNFLDVWVERESGWKLVSSHYSQSA